MKKREVHLLLHNIRSVHNVGAIFRTADAIGVSKIYLSGYTPTPIDRFGNPRKDFAKCALGAEKTMGWEAVKNPSALIAKLKIENCEIIAVEQSPRSVDYKKVKPFGGTQGKPKKDYLVIFGNEVEGISKNILEKADIIAEISMRGTKESLNVSVAAGIILFRWFDR